MPVSPPAPLERLAAMHGVATSYDDWSGRTVQVAPAVVVATLAALDVAAHDETAVSQSLDEAAAAPWRRLLAPVTVIRGRGVVEVRGPAGARVELQVRLEDGETVDVPAVRLPPGRSSGVDERAGRTLHQVSLPDLPLGWHHLHVTVTGPDTTNPDTTIPDTTGPDVVGGSVGGAPAIESDQAVLVVAPRRIGLPAGLGRAWGWMVQLYSLRSAASWGVGDYADLETVVARSAADGAGVLLLNPVHAETPVVPLNPSPYSPSSRLFRSPVWLRVEQLPEYRAAPADVQARIDRLRPDTDPDRVWRDPAWAAKLAALELLWPTARPVDGFRQEHGRALEDFAVFCALAEVHGTPWQQWPPGLQRPDGPDVAVAREVHADRIRFWCWVQMLVDEQLARVATTAGGMAVGVIHDLAVGVDAGGADAWALQDALALGSRVGAPPDSFNQQGQDWGLPPWRPDRLRELAYAPYRAVVQGVLRHAGGLRIDHVMGLFRLWWVPEGAGAAEGTYVSYDADALLGILSLEAVRAGALVVGEDLGTVEDRVRVALEDAGILGSAVLWFERDPDTGAFRDPVSWRESVLATVTTHDLPTAAGFLAQEHVRVRDELGQLGIPLEQERARAAQERTGLLDMLGRTGLLDRYGPDVVPAMHGALVSSPARLVVAALADAVGDLRQPNLPGTVDQYPNWRLPVADGSGCPLYLESLLDAPAVRDLTTLLVEGLGRVEYGSDTRTTPPTGAVTAHPSTTDTARMP